MSKVKIWNVIRRNTLEWASDPFGPEECSDFLTFKIVKKIPEFTVQQIEDGINQNVDLVLDPDLNEPNFNVFWDVCHFKIWRTEYFSNDSPKVQIVARLEYTEGRYATDEHGSEKSINKETRRLMNRGCTHHKKYCKHPNADLLSNLEQQQ